MKLDDLILVSVDDHAIEPRGAFDRHMPAKFKGRQPKVVQSRAVTSGSSKTARQATWA